MGVITSIRDGLANLVSGRGTSADKSQHNFYAHCTLSPDQINAAFRSSWLMRKAIELPPFDMIRAGWDWQADKDQIDLIEAEEKRHDIRGKVRRALVLGRLGGGVVILGVKQGDPREPLYIDRIGKGALEYAHIMSRHQLSFDEIDKDPKSPTFGQPRMWTMAAAGQRVDIHPSRVIAFKGEQVPDFGLANEQDLFWGDSVVQSIMDAVKNADAAQSGFASLIEEAKLDIIKVPGLMSNLATTEYEQRFLRRLGLANIGKSTHNALIIDGEEDWEQRQVNWSGMPDIMNTYLGFVAGAADVPATRLLGKSPDGMNSTGLGDLQNYETMISARQENDLRPLLERIEEVVIRSAIGTRDPDVYFTFAPLRVMTEKESADIGKVKADTVKVYSDSGLIPTIALEKAVQNMLVEDGLFPGLDGALAELGEEERFPSLGEEDGEDDPSALVAAVAPPAKIAANDAAPRSLYVSRKVVNVGDLEAWAKEQGLPALRPDLHVTIIYSRAPVDWMKVENEWGENEKGQIIISPGGARLVEPLGDRTAVLLFSSSTLSWRHENILRAGATHGFPDYQPHISLTGEPVDLSEVEPYRGKIVLGPEIFEELNEGGD